MRQVISQDGTSIAFDRLGNGPSIILVGGASTDRSENTSLAALLAQRFTALNYDRRGRGDSGDTAPYAVDREVEDIEALINEAGGDAFVVGFSSGAALAYRQQLTVSRSKSSYCLSHRSSSMVASLDRRQT